mgnify:CR=1 FL=1
MKLVRTVGDGGLAARQYVRGGCSVVFLRLFIKTKKSNWNCLGTKALRNSAEDDHDDHDNHDDHDDHDDCDNHDNHDDHDDPANPTNTNDPSDPTILEELEQLEDPDNPVKCNNEDGPYKLRA